MNAVIFLLLGITIAPVLSELEIFDGLCPSSEVDVIENFNQTQFQGFWHVIQRYEENELSSCVRLNYFWTNETRQFDEILRQKDSNGTTTHFSRSIVKERDLFSNTGKYKHRYSLLKVQDYHYVDTDYENYAVLWTCLQNGRTNAQNLLVMARDKFFDINSLESLNATLAKPPFDRSLLKHIDQENEECK